MPGLVRTALVLLASLSVALAATGAGNDASGAVAPAAVAPVPSLEPDQTSALWSRLVTTRPRSAQQAGCRPLRAVFYAASDWLRLATKLAANASPCADYYVSIPPLVADKTQPRRDQAWRIRALGRRFHALAEIHWATWSRWVASTGSSWHQAGVTARERMAAAGYDVAEGDTWALNEVTSTVRRGTGQARANLREFLRGLYEGDGSRPTRGAAFVIGIGQRTSDLSLYQTNAQAWLTDAAFWADVATYVEDWSQQVYGDYRSYAVPGAPFDVRRDYLDDYLQHFLLLAGAGPAEVEAARTFLANAHTPLANAAWQRDSGYGWTMVPADQMAGYVSAQVYALRHFSATTGQARDHWGFAWAPRNLSGLPQSEFGAQTGAVLDRLAAAIRDSGSQSVADDPGSEACGPPGRNVWCAGELPDARPSGGWRSFRTWSQPLLTFTSPAQTLTAGTPSAPLGLALVTPAGTPEPAKADLAVTVASSSPAGTFAVSPEGPWTPTLALTVPAGTNTTGAFYYLDTQAGTHTLTASAAGVTSATQPVTVTPAAVARLAVAPGSGSVRVRGSRSFSARATDAYGNIVGASVRWGVAPGTLGTVRPASAGTATFTARRRVGTGRVVAAVDTPAGTASTTAAVTVTPGRLRLGPISSRRTTKGFRVIVGAVDGARRPVSQAVVVLSLKPDGARRVTRREVTGASGRAVLSLRMPRGTCTTIRVIRTAAPGFEWDGRTRRSRVCRRPA